MKNITRGVLMKKLNLILFMFLMFGCAGTFEYIAIPQTAIENPTFSVYVEGIYGEYYNTKLKEQIENALMLQKVSVLTLANSKQFVTTTSGEGKSAAAQDNSGVAIAKGKVDITTTAEFQRQVKSDYLFQANYDHWTFSVISMKNQEIVAKGTFTTLHADDIKSNVKIILKEMKIIH
jgi:hypothetical protein